MALPIYVWTGTEYVPVGGGSGSGSSVAYQPAAPASPVIGDIWIDSDAIVPSAGTGTGETFNPFFLTGA